MTAFIGRALDFYLGYLDAQDAGIFLPAAAHFLSAFDPIPGSGKTPALRAFVAQRVSLVTPAVYPAFSFVPSSGLSSW